MYRYVHHDRASRNRNRMTIDIPLQIYEGEEGEHERPLPAEAFLGDDGEYLLSLPACFTICDRCEGRGTHTNPNIDGNGITQDEWAEWADEERETYLSGGYDVPCEARCEDGKVLVVNDDHLSEELKFWVARWEEYEQDSAADGRSDARTRWYEDGCPMD